MIKIIIDKILIRLKKINDLIKIYFLKKKIRQLVLSNKINSILFFKLILKYIQFQDKNEFVAIGYLKKKIEIDQFKKNLNPIEYLLPSQQIPLPGFFRNNISSFDINQCLGLGELDNQQVYDKKLNSLTRQANDLDCNYFISLISEKKPFHYLKYTHGFWDNLTKSAIKEYALINGKDLVMQSHTAYVNHIFNNQFMNDIFQLVSSKKFLDAVKSRDIYFCPTTSNGSIGSKIEFKIMKELSKKNFLYQYSQIMLMEEFSKHKEITPSNIFKKIICTDLLRDVFLDKIKQYDLILVCNHRAASKISKIYPNFKKIYCLPDHRQDLKHFANPSKFAHDVCKSVLSRGSTKPTLILSQSSTLSTFISYEILNKYQTENISLIDVGKPLQTLFSPEISGGGKWRDKDRLGHGFQKMPHLIPNDLFTELMEDTKTETAEIKFKNDMDIEMASSYQKKLF
ncbi:hypothetical protein N8950_00450 [Candidatus Pelagibacter sp.]|nr:hypothetical protein [Candidatus Pelagibacter sp.]|tara:strand:- start:1765 stop:3129 length:1365 start_codon:yes stop_codon:yes gene_type:complete